MSKKGKKNMFDKNKEAVKRLKSNKDGKLLEKKLRFGKLLFYHIKGWFVFN